MVLNSCNNQFDFADALGQLCSNFPESLVEEIYKSKRCEGFGPANQGKLKITEEFASYYFSPEKNHHEPLKRIQTNLKYWEADVSGHEHVHDSLNDKS